jgi:hypothetical protein
MQTYKYPHLRRKSSAAKEFHIRVEIPLEESFLDWMIMGTICGGFGAFLACANLPLPNILSAVLSFSVVGLISGWLVFGLYDVICNGRLEYDAELPQDETDELNLTSGGYSIGQTGGNLLLPKAS